jgi:hypothetical protein
MQVQHAGMASAAAAPARAPAVWPQSQVSHLAHVDHLLPFQRHQRHQARVHDD